MMMDGTMMRMMITVFLLLISCSLAFQPTTPSSSKATRMSSLFADDKQRSGYTTDLGYNQFLRKRLLPVERLKEQREQRRKDSMEDGYEDMFEKRRTPLRRILKMPHLLYKRMTRTPVDPGTLILIRHGESLWNANQTFTGWADPDLSERGYREAEYAAR